MNAEPANGEVQGFRGIPEPKDEREARKIENIIAFPIGALYHEPAVDEVFLFTLYVEESLMSLSMRTVSLRGSLSGFATIVALSIAVGSVSAQTNVDLNTWSKKGPASNGNWVVHGSGDFVTQTINGSPTYFVSPNDFFNTTIEGKFQVLGTFDNDYIGFVFGYNEPGQNSTDATFNLLDWKQANQSGSEAGFRLSQVNGFSTPPFGNAENDNLPDYDVLAINTTTSNTGNVAGWADNTEYDFKLLYTETRIKVDISGGTGLFQNGLTVFDVAPADVGLASNFVTGQFGFFNHSQSDVRYESFTRTLPSLATLPDEGGTLHFLARTGDSATEVVNVSNTGGAGTTLTGTSGSPSGLLFAGPSEAAGFSYGAGDSSDFTYTYSPTFRTAGTPDTDSVGIASNEDGSNTIGFSGVAIGPVADFAFDGNAVNPSSTLGFGSIESDQMKSLLLTLANVSPDDDGGIHALTDLTIDNILISGADAAKFSVVGFTTGEVISQAGELNVELKFNPASMDGTFDATLTILTDEGAPLAGNGADFVFQLAGAATTIPEPTSLLLVLFGLAASQITSSRRHSHC